MGLAARFGLRIKDVRAAECTPAESVGDFVCIVDDPPNGYDLVGKADPEDFNRLPAVGAIINKSSPTRCLVQWLGETPNIFSGLSSGEVYFLGADAKPADVPPVPSGVPAFAQSVAVATAPTRLYIKPSDQLTKRIP
jgi:hypothetical protein